MQTRSRRKTQARNIPRIRRNFRLHKHNMQHRRILSASANDCNFNYCSTWNRIRGIQQQLERGYPLWLSYGSGQKMTSAFPKCRCLSGPHLLCPLIITARESKSPAPEFYRSSDRFPLKG
jgi:hypothetical protein